MLAIFAVLASVPEDRSAFRIRIYVFARPLAGFCARSLAGSVAELEEVAEAVTIADSGLDLCLVENPQNKVADAEAADMCRSCGWILEVQGVYLAETVVAAADVVVLDSH